MNPKLHFKPLELKRDGYISQLKKYTSTGDYKNLQKQNQPAQIENHGRDVRQNSAKMNFKQTEKLINIKSFNY